jgi:hypothetical protein
MMWGAISYARTTQLVHISGNWSSLFRDGSMLCYRLMVGTPDTCIPVELFGHRIWHPTSSHFLHRNCRPQWRSFLRTSHSGVCRHVYGHLFSAAWILIHRWTRFDSWETGPWQQEKHHQMSQISDEYRHRQSEIVSVKTAYSPWMLLIWCSTETSESICNGPMVQQSKGLGPAKLTGGESGLLINGPVSQLKYPGVAILGCWCIRAVLQANGGHTIYWLWSDVIWMLWTLMR